MLDAQAEALARVEATTKQLPLAGFRRNWGAIYDDARANKICEIRKLSTHQIFDIDSLPLVSNQQFPGVGTTQLGACYLIIAQLQ
jgi:hypothetical protein